MTAEILPMVRRSYEAKPFQCEASGFLIKISGTLDGFLDFSIQQSDGKNRTYNVTPDEARVIAAHLVSAAEDVARHCLYDKDPLLMPEGTP